MRFQLDDRVSISGFGTGTENSSGSANGAVDVPAGWPSAPISICSSLESHSPGADGLSSDRNTGGMTESMIS